MKGGIIICWKLIILIQTLTRALVAKSILSIIPGDETQRQRGKRALGHTPSFSIFSLILYKSGSCISVIQDEVREKSMITCKIGEKISKNAKNLLGKTGSP